MSTTILDLFPTYPLRHIHQTRLPGGYLNEEGQADLNLYLDGQRLSRPPYGFDYSWVTSRGTFPKRLANHYYKKGIVLSTTQISEIGNIAKKHSGDAHQVVYFDITDKIDWSSGTFGDSGSCYWGERRNAKRMITDNGGGALRLWKPKPSYTEAVETLDYPLKPLSKGHHMFNGYGRCWVGPSEHGPILFNAYPAGVDLLWMGKLAAHLLGCSYKKIDLCNCDDYEGTLYMNSDGFVVGSSEEIRTLMRYDFEWADPGNDARCHGCGSYFDTDDGYYLDGDAFCPDCAGYCECCGENFLREDLLYSYQGHVFTWGYGYCKDCIRKEAMLCDMCSHAFIQKQGMKSDHHGWMCPSCKGKVRECVRCHENAYWNNEHDICGRCEQKEKEAA